MEDSFVECVQCERRRRWLKAFVCASHKRKCREVVVKSEIKERHEGKKKTRGVDKS
jgi:hypothetical protein